MYILYYLCKVLKLIVIIIIIAVVVIMKIAVYLYITSETFDLSLK